MSYYCCASQCSSSLSRLFSMTDWDRLDAEGGGSRRTWIIQIGNARALAPDHVPGGVTWADELRGASRIQVIWKRGRGTICRRDNHHRDVEPTHDGYCVHVPHSVRTFSDERGKVKRSRAHHCKSLYSRRLEASIPPPLRAPHPARCPGE